MKKYLLMLVLFSYSACSTSSAFVLDFLQSGGDTGSTGPNYELANTFVNSLVSVNLCPVLYNGNARYGIKYTQDSDKLYFDSYDNDISGIKGKKGCILIDDIANNIKNSSDTTLTFVGSSSMFDYTSISVTYNDTTYKTPIVITHLNMFNNTVCSGNNMTWTK